MPVFYENKKHLIILALLIFFHLILISIQIPRGKESTYFEKAVFFIISPVKHGIVWLYSQTGKLMEDYFWLRQLRKENKEMQEEIFMLNQENIFLREALKKFKSQKEVHKLLQKIHEQVLSARIINLDASNFYKSAVINRGKKDGVEKNMIVLDRYGNLVGRIIEPISLREARVQLITDDESGISVFSEKKKVMGVVSGDGKGRCYLKYIIKTNHNIREGEKVVTSGFDAIYPAGLNVGVITSITETSSLFKTIKVDPFFKFRELDQVAVIMSDTRDL